MTQDVNNRPNKNCPENSEQDKKKNENIKRGDVGRGLGRGGGKGRRDGSGGGRGRGGGGKGGRRNPAE